MIGSDGSVCCGRDCNGAERTTCPVTLPALFIEHVRAAAVLPSCYHAPLLLKHVRYLRSVCACDAALNTGIRERTLTYDRHGLGGAAVVCLACLSPYPTIQRCCLRWQAPAPAASAYTASP